MAYVIEALVGSEAVLRNVTKKCPEASLVLIGSGFGLVPLTDDLCSSLGGDRIEGFSCLSTSIEDLAKNASMGGILAYIEAEYFGGDGAQGSVVWEDGVCVIEVRRSQDAINRALAKLGVQVQAARDEFDELGLGRHRGTEEWSNEEGGNPSAS